MKWPFVRRSKYEEIFLYAKNRHLDVVSQEDEINCLTQKLEEEKSNFERRFRNVNKIKDEYAQLNHDNLVEINRLNQELANELNSHRETKDHNKRLFAKNETLKKELEETNRKYEYKLNFEQECTEKIGIELEETKDALKIAIDDLKNAALCIGEQKTQLEIWKKRSNFYSNNCTEAKESISRVTGYLKTIAKKL